MTEAFSLTLARLREQRGVYLVGFAHGATHWLGATFYIVLPYLAKDLGLSYTAAGLLASMMSVSSVLANLGAGALVDLSGRRVLFMAGTLTITASGMLLLGFSPWYALMFLFVGLIGGANNAWHPAAISYLSQRFPSLRSYALAIHATGASVGDMVAPLAAGAMLVSLSWRETTAISAAPVFLIALYFWLVVLPRDAAGPQQDMRGMDARTYWGGFLQLVKNRAVVGLCLMSALRAMAQNGLMLFLPLYLANELKVNPVVVGTTVMAMQLGGVVVSPFAGIAADRFGPRRVVLAGITASTVIIPLLTLVTNSLAFVSIVSVLGFVLYAVRPVMLGWMMDLSPDNVRGSATSLQFGSMATFSALMPLIGGAVADTWGMTWVFWVIAGAMLLANGMAVLLPPPRREAA